MKQYRSEKAGQAILQSYDQLLKQWQIPLEEADPFQILGGKEALLRHRMHAIWYPRAGHGLNHELAQEINLKIQQYFLDEHI